MDNSAALQLVEAGIVSKSDWSRIGSTRDRDDISVLKCNASGVIFLETSSHISDEYYASEHDPRKGTQIGDKYIRPPRTDDSPRRSDFVAPLVRGKKWLDFGAGWGELLRELSDECSEAIAVEPSHIKQDSMRTAGVHAVASVEEIEAGSVDVVSLFHVLEHLQDPLGTLSDLRVRMAEKALLILEVPHARDALLSLYESAHFSRFTFWSQHLVLHTRESLERVAEQAGFRDVWIQGVQRYGVANHLHWLARGLPGGQNAWPFLASRSLDEVYAARLASIDATDTLFAVATPA